MFSNLGHQTPVLMALAAVSAYALTALARFAAPRLGVLDHPDGARKSHAAPMPLLGGVAVFAAVLVAMGVTAGGIAPSAAERLPLVPFLVSAGLFCALGLWDDMRGLRPRTKLLCMALATLPFILGGRSIETIHVLGWQVELGVVGFAFTVFWLVACANVMNLVDGLDGLAATIGLIISASIAVLADLKGATGAAGLALVFCGALAGFLGHNLPPARIYLGDSGSLLIGFVVGALAIEASLKTAAGFALAVPLILLSVPVFDTLMAIVRRVLSGRGIGQGDRSHIHHRLQDRGLSRGQALLAIAGLCAAMAAVTLFSAWFQTDVVGLGMCLALLALLIYGQVFGYEETLLFLKHVRALGGVWRDAAGGLRMRFFLLRLLPAGGRPLAESWEQLTRRVRAMGVERLELVRRGSGEGPIALRLEWTQDLPADGQPRWQFRYAVEAGSEEISLNAVGQSFPRWKQQRFIDLFHLFDAFCRYRLAADVTGADAPPPRMSIAMEPEPRPPIAGHTPEPAGDVIPLPQRDRRVA
ncbi:MAG: undecaprenyl/decaprenyl-phosphate alpha-N-acetylglucosaminyl 1-phosphate transferase, partial [Planctomycetes bacterium]|nr:undecaprenyl/decaprenyl-phosphate alpha-N-acetylglucosaminyl 1-phosphate transferase [Planctomycetota bacterium]